METQSHKKRPRSSSNASTSSLSGSTERPLKACRPQRGDIPTDVPIDQPNIIHRVKCSRASEYHSEHPLGGCYLDVPALPANGNRATALHGQKPLLDVESYLAGWIEFKFVVYLEYDCEAYHKRIEDRFMRLPMPSMPHSMSIQSKPYFQILRYDGPPAKAKSECIQLSESLEKALCALRDHNKETFEEWKFKEVHVYPYQKLYHFRNMCVEPSLQAPGWQHNIEIAALFHYLARRLSSSYEKLPELAAAGMADQKYWAMLFQLDDIVVTTHNGQSRAFMVSSCHLVYQNTLIMNCRSWEYDGNFFRKQTTLSHVWPSSSEQIQITELPVYPLRYAADGVESELRDRGETFWACRRQKYVNYNVPLQGLGSQLANLRYMVDMEAYKLMHGSDDDPTTRNELSDDAMESDKPPSSSFTLMLPATIHGYGFHDKKWKVLFVEHIRDIKWNKEVFEHQLVLQEGKKELVKALVSVHIEKDDTIGTDFMDGKGEGLIVLLHGGPGTGKTLTAESIAELVERPLYRVTCGDIGTDAESVEKYLESVLYIGSNWKCVVLMDEADVFLEERTKLDMQRNALVSVFLRVLEYYNGILILTTNRIGTFDEAFKSRIQLALHYPPLDRDGRWEVWRNFVQSLSETGENINTGEISKKLDILARHKLNGRQIRNTVNTARQLARYKKETIRYAHIDQAIGVVNEFEKYVTDVHGHDDEEYAQDQGLRNDQALRDVD